MATTGVFEMLNEVNEQIRIMQEQLIQLEAQREVLLSIAALLGTKSSYHTEGGAQ